MVKNKYFGLYFTESKKYGIWNQKQCIVNNDKNQKKKSVTVYVKGQQFVANVCSEGSLNQVKTHFLENRINKYITSSDDESDEEDEEVKSKHQKQLKLSNVRTQELYSDMLEDDTSTENEMEDDDEDEDERSLNHKPNPKKVVNQNRLNSTQILAQETNLNSLATLSLTGSNSNNRAASTQLSDNPRPTISSLSLLTSTSSSSSSSSANSFEEIKNYMDNKLKEQYDLIEQRLTANNNNRNIENDDVEMHGEKNLIEIPGADPSKYAQRVLLHILGNDLKDYICTDDGKPSRGSTKQPIPINTIQTLQRCIKKRFSMKNKVFSKVWPSIRTNINTRSRCIKFVARKKAREAATTASSTNGTLPSTVVNTSDAASSNDGAINGLANESPITAA